MSDDELASQLRVWIRAFWGFDPACDGYMGFTKPAARERFLKLARKGDLVLVYGAESEFTANEQRRQALGFLEVDPVPIMDVERASAEGMKRKLDSGWQDRWRYAVPVTRAWRVNRRIEIRHIAPTTYVHERARVIASMAELLTEDEAKTALALPVSAVSVFGEAPINEETREYALSSEFRPSRGITPTFGARSSVHADGEHRLYILVAHGNIAAFLGRPEHRVYDKHLVKVGYSNDVKRRCDEHNCGFPPAAAFKWQVEIQSRPYLNGADAKIAEDHLKAALAKRFESLGGEFFLGNLDEIKRAFYDIPDVAFRITATSTTKK